MSQIEITGRDLKKKVIVSYGTEDAPKQDKNGKDYRVLVFQSTAFRVSEKVFALWEAGKLAALTLDEGTRSVEVTDAEGGKKMVDQKTLAYAGHDTKDSEMEELTYEAKKALITQTVAKEAGLDMQKIAALETAGID